MKQTPSRVDEREGRGDAIVRRSYAASLSVLRGVVPFLAGGGGMAGRLARGVQTVPRLAAAALCGSVPAVRRAHALSEASLHCREAVVVLSYCRDLHGRFINGALCAELIATYRALDAEIAALLDAGRTHAEAAP